MKDNLFLQKRRAERVRWKIKNQKAEHPRLSIYKSNNHIYAQIIDDVKGVTLASASTLTKGKNGPNIAAAVEVGKKIAQSAKDAKVTQVVFDRGGYRYHGRIKALADAAREGGLKF